MFPEYFVQQIEGSCQKILEVEKFFRSFAYRFPPVLEKLHLIEREADMILINVSALNKGIEGMENVSLRQFQRSEKENQALRHRIDELEDILIEHGIPIPDENPLVEMTDV